ncbi:uncharacterized protein LOC115241474 [Formica exsecta]|uniref:uncharacterized protein LOC115241474 n=1 Tax=Formica exsecta TaxID=72781 RepID=UPI0011449ED0|nr:uncharacterized protein LOC115241474 [Formica exsecta]
MSKDKPTMPIPRSPVKGAKKQTASEEINVITQVTAEAERLKEQNSKLREEMEYLKEKLEDLKTDRENGPGKSEEDYARESGARRRRDRPHQTRENTAYASNSLGEENTNMLGNVRLPRGGWLMDPFAEIKYKRREDGQNPIKFLRKFEKIADYENIDYRDQLHYFKKCMKGNASNWIEVNDPDDIEEAKESFREYFWGDEQQARFRENLYTGKYKSEKGETMAEYAMSLARQAKYLEPPMSDHEIIRCVKRHFGNKIAREIRPSTAKSIGELTSLLDDMEYEKKIVKQSRRQNTEENQLNARKTYDTRQRPETAFRDNGPRRFNEQYPRYGPDRISEIPNSEGDNENKRVVGYGRNTARDRIREDKIVPKAQTTKKRVEKIERERYSGEEESEIESQEEDRESESAIASIRTENILKDVDEVFYEDQAKIKIQKGPFVTATFKKLNVKCLIDTGAQVSAMSKEIYDQLKQNGVKMEIQPVEKMQLREIVEVLMSDEAESDAENRGIKDFDKKERGERAKENMIERIVEEEEGKSIAMLNLHGPFFGARSEQKYALSLTDARNGSKKTYYMPDKRLKTLTDTIANKYLKTERKPDIIVTDRQGQFRNDKWRIFCNRMGMRARTLNPTVNIARNSREIEIHVIDLQEEEENIMEQNRKIQDMRSQLATIQVRKQKETEVIPSPMQLCQKAKEKERHRNPKEVDSRDCEEVRSRRGSDVDSVAKKSERRKETHKESRSNQGNVKESREKDIHILNQSIQNEKGEENNPSPTMTSRDLKHKETRRGSSMRESENEKILTNPQPRRGSEQAKSLKRSIGHSSEAETGDESMREPVKKKRINQEAFELMLRVKDILSEQIPAKKMLAKIQISKCKAYIDKEGKCDVITKTCTERLTNEGLNMTYVQKEDLIPDCIKEISEMGVRMIQLRATIDDKEIEIHPIVLFGRKDAIILGKESYEKLTWLQKKWREQVQPMVQSDEHIQMREPTASDKETMEQPKGVARKAGAYKYVTMSKYYRELKREKRQLIDLMHDTYKDERERTDMLRDRLIRLRKRHKFVIQRRRKGPTANERDIGQRRESADPDNSEETGSSVRKKQARDVQAKPRVTQHLVGKFVDPGGKTFETRLLETKIQRDQQQTLDLESEKWFEEYQQKENVVPNQQKGDHIESPAGSSSRHESYNMQSENHSPVRKKRKAIKIVSSEDEADNENQTTSDRTNHSPVFGKVLSKYVPNFEKTLEGGMRSAGSVPVEEIRGGAWESEEDNTGCGPRERGSSLCRKDDLRGVLEHRRRAV